jgi:hypothetical protein
MVDERFVRQTARISREIHDSGLRVFALAAGVAPAAEVFGNLEESDGEITAVEVLHAPPGGPWVRVDSGRGRRAPLRMLLEQRVRFDGGRFSEQVWTEGPATMLVDGRPEPAEVVRAGARWWAMRARAGAVSITVVSRDWHPETVAVATLADPVPMLDRLATVVAPEAAPYRPEPVPPGEPHRLLIETELCREIEHAKWIADGGPMPVSPVHLGELWQAAVLRQMDLTGDRDLEAADLAVSGMVSLVAALQHGTGWFRNDDELRGRAIAEILLRVTGLAPDVPSRAAQEAWHHRADGQDWLDRWRDWAGGRP